MKNQDKKAGQFSRRQFLKLFGAGAVATTATMVGCKNKVERTVEAEYKNQVEPPVGQMTYREIPNTGKVSLLGYGMMRLPTITGEAARESKEAIRKISREM